MLASGKEGHRCQGTDLILVNPVEGLGRRRCCPTASPRLQVPRSRQACEGTAGEPRRPKPRLPEGGDVKPRSPGEAGGVPAILNHLQLRRRRRTWMKGAKQTLVRKNKRQVPEAGRAGRPGRVLAEGASSGRAREGTVGL